MAKIRTIKGQIVAEAVRRWREIPTQTLAKFIVANNEGVFDSVEHARGLIRNYRGKRGKAARGYMADKSLFTETVKMPRTWRVEVEDYILPPGLWLVISDLHVPFHEPKPVDAALDCGLIEKVEGILILGDFQDCASLSYWRQAKRKFVREAEATLDMFDHLRGKFKNQRIVYKPGNHEYRLPAYYISHAAELAETPMTDMQTYLGFKSRGIKFLEYKQRIRAGYATLVHGHEVRYVSKAVNMARGIFNKAHAITICGHGHQTSEHAEPNINDEDIVCWSIGCLCDLHPDWNPLCNKWNWGFGLLELEKDKSFTFINKKVLRDGRVK